MTLERTTVHISDDTGRVAVLETRTFGMDESKSELKRFIYSNHLQSASLELDVNGDIISYEEYHPYGTTSYQAKSATINATAKRYRYTGKERDDESRLNYHGARYYALWLARWISVDPLESKYAPQSPFAYCSNNPVNRVDPSGMGDYDKYAIKREIPRATADNLAPGRLAPNGPDAPAPVALTPTTVRPIGASSADNLHRQSAPQVATETVKTPVLGYVHQAAIGTTNKGQAALGSMSNRYVSPAEKWKNKQDQLKAFRSAGLEDDGTESAGHKFWSGPRGRAVTEGLSTAVDVATYIDLGVSIPSMLKRFGAKQVLKSTLTETSEVLQTRSFRGLSNNEGHIFAESVTEGGTGMAFAGHGMITTDKTTRFIIPEGSTLTIWTRKGESITDPMGKLIENGRFDLVLKDEYMLKIMTGTENRMGAVTYLPGATVPDFLLSSPGKLNIMSESITVSDPTRLSQLLKPNMGHMQWAACLNFPSLIK